MGLGLVDGFKEAIRVLLGLPSDSGQPPDLMRLGRYRARVDVCQSDGAHVDLTPDDKRISPEKNVPVRVGVPGLVAVVSPGAVVDLGWEGGDPSKPYCVPNWESGATITKFEVGSSPDGVATKADITALISSLNAATAPSGGGTLSFPTPLPTSYASTVVKVQR